jgi:pilus assembly protein CpaC
MRLRTILFGLLLCLPMLPSAKAAETRRTLSFETGAGRVVELPGPAANVFVADPKIAEVRPASPTTLFIFGVSPGRTSVAVLDNAGKPVADLDITVRPSSFAAGEAEAAISRAIPGSRLRVQQLPRGLSISGPATSADEAVRARSIARGFLAEGQSVDDQIIIAAPMQVTLRVRIAEVSRTVTRDMGINWQAMGSIGRFALNFTTANALSVASGFSSLRAGTKDANALIDALAQDNLARILAEPNLTAMSGQPASFLAGGEFPIPVGLQNGQVSIEFKRYGVQLTFVPTVLSDDRINLHVSPEVSQLTTQGAVTLPAGQNSVQVPALTVRRAESTVEIGNGQSFAIAGLLQDTVQSGGNGVPFLGDVPVLGALFRSDHFQRQETELVILITPYIVRPVSDPQALRVPGENFRPASDLERILMLRQIGAAATPSHQSVPRQRLPGQAGFVIQ